jgi:hypothetical protein
MSASIQSNAGYKRRLISAMLQEPASCHVPGSLSFYAANWSPKLVAAVAGLALVSAAGMFLFLFHHDASAADPTSRPVAQAAQIRNGNDGVAGEQLVASESVPGAVASGAFTARNVADHNVTSAAPLEFSLKRSRNFETVGPIGIRLLRVNLRRRTCDLTVRLSNHRIVQRRLVLNKPLEVKQQRSAEPVQIIVSSIARSSVTGLVGIPSTNSNLAKRLD